MLVAWGCLTPHITAEKETLPSFMGLSLNCMDVTTLIDQYLMLFSQLRKRLVKGNKRRHRKLGDCHKAKLDMS